MGFRLVEGLAGIDGPGKNLRVGDTEFDGLGDEREVLVSDAGERLALFRGECPASGQLALDGREMGLRGFQCGGIVGRCDGGRGHFLNAFLERIPDSRCEPRPLLAPLGESVALHLGRAVKFAERFLSNGADFYQAGLRPAGMSRNLTPPPPKC